MTECIAIANQKGGVGKTTTAINLSASLSAAKRRVLLIDLDPQGNATTGSGLDKHHLAYSINDVLLGKCLIEQAMLEACSGVTCVPTNADLTEAEIRLMEKPDKEQILKRSLEPLRTRYDFIIIDCPPSLNVLTLNALVAADSVLIPMQCEYYALEGLASLLDTIEQVRSELNARLTIKGLLRTMYDSRNRLTNEVSQQLQEHFPEKVYQTTIPRNVRLAEAPSHGQPILEYDKRSPGALAYLALAGEILRKQHHK